MLDKIIHFSINNKFIVGLFTLALIIIGCYSLYNLPIDALPDITNNQVQIITISPTLATQKVEQHTFIYHAGFYSRAWSGYSVLFSNKPMASVLPCWYAICRASRPRASFRDISASFSNSRLII